MNTFEFARKIEKIDENVIREIAGLTIIEKNNDVTEIIKNQLWDGKTGKGKEITPSYSNDPFFKTKAQAIAYRNWKNSITKNPDRNEDSPNLFINGYFYDSLFINNNSFEISSNSFGNPIIQKYGVDTFIVNSNNQENKEAMSDIRKSFIEKIKIS